MKSTCALLAAIFVAVSLSGCGKGRVRDFAVWVQRRLTRQIANGLETVIALGHVLLDRRSRFGSESAGRECGEDIGSGTGLFHSCSSKSEGFAP